MNVIDSIKIGTDADEGLITLPYAYCETVAGTADKVIAPTNFVVETGTIVVVKFKETNSAANPKLKYGESAKPIHYHGSAITAEYLKAGYVYTFIYTGAAWELIGEIDTNTEGTNSAHSHGEGIGLKLTQTGNTTSGKVTYGINIDGASAGQCLKVTVDANGKPNGVEWGTVSSSDEYVKQVRIPTGVTATYYLLGSYLNTNATPDDLTNHVRVSSIKLSNYGKDLTTDGTITASTFNATSDSRLKENFEEFIPEKSILDLPIYKFDFIGGLKNQIGCKAQDLQEICPEIVSEDSDGYLSIQESKLCYLLLVEICKLRERIKLLEGR